MGGRASPACGGLSGKSDPGAMSCSIIPIILNMRKRWRSWGLTSGRTFTACTGLAPGSVDDLGLACRLITIIARAEAGDVERLERYPVEGGPYEQSDI
jgi:hypothetical protein